MTVGGFIADISHCESQDAQLDAPMVSSTMATERNLKRKMKYSISEDSAIKTLGKMISDYFGVIFNITCSI